jgi:hypothetical protein
MPITRAFSGRDFVDSMIAAGIVPENCTKVIIEAEYNNLVTIHYSVLADGRLLNVIPALAKDAEVKI